MTRRRFTIRIDGMTCGGCVRRVSTALRSIEGVEVEAVEVGQATGFIVDDDVVVADLSAALSKLGFSPQPVPEGT